MDRFHKNQTKPYFVLSFVPHDTHSPLGNYTIIIVRILSMISFGKTLFFKLVI